jgi:hypothetical protein
VYRGGVTFLQIKRLTGRQAAIGRGLAAGPHAAAAPVASGQAAEPPTMPLPVTGVAAGQGPAPAARPPWEPAAWRPDPGGEAAWSLPGPALPDVSEVLDEAFGERHE